MTATKAAPVGTVMDQIETLMGEIRRLGLTSTSPWGETDLTMPQMRAIALVRLQQPISIGSLSSAMGMSLASGSALADRLVRAGYLQRRQDPDDRRLVLLELEPKAAELLQGIEQRSRTKLRSAVAAMEPHEREALATALSAFLRVLREKAGSRT